MWEKQGHTPGPVSILCKEIGFPFDRRLEREDVFVSFVRRLVGEVEDIIRTADALAEFTGKPSSEGAREVLGLALSMSSLDLGLSLSARTEFAAAIHERSHQINPDDPRHSCDHAVDMLASCASAIRFGLERPCRSRHAADAASHVWKHVYGVSRFDGITPAWQKEWARGVMQSAIIDLLPAISRPTGEDSPANEGEGAS